MSRGRLVGGFDYREQRQRQQPMPAWKAEITAVCQCGGSCCRIAGDLTAFDARRVMLFEVYDRDGSADVRH